MKAVIMAGGKGTRIASVASDIPKPMIPVHGKPVLAYGIESLCTQGFRDIILVIGHLGQIIKDYFGDGSKFGASISYFEERAPLGTAGALAFLRDELTEDFILLNGDIIFDIDFGRFTAWHREKGAAATLFCHPNSHPYDSALIAADENSRAVNWLHKEDVRGDYKNRVNAGIHILSPAVLEKITLGQKTDLDRDVLKPLIVQGQVYVYDSPEYVRDMGTPERYQKVCQDVADGAIQARNLRRKQKAIFLDRDGTINRYKGFITDKEEIELLNGAAEGIGILNQLGYLTIIVTNQPVIARGECTPQELEGIHQRLERLLGEQGAYVDAIYFCPHHPDKGFAGERLEYKIECECRKPKPGMLRQAAADYNISLKDSFMIGDDARDIEAGRAAGCKTIYIGPEKGIPADYHRENLLTAAQLLQGESSKEEQRG